MIEDMEYNTVSSNKWKPVLVLIPAYCNYADFCMLKTVCNVYMVACDKSKVIAKFNS
jgi:hypothetical protein